MLLGVPTVWALRPIFARLGPIRREAEDRQGLVVFAPESITSRDCQYVPIAVAAHHSEVKWAVKRQIGAAVDPSFVELKDTLHGAAMTCQSKNRPANG